MKLFYDNGLMSMNTITFCTVHQIKRKNIYNYVDDIDTNIFVNYDHRPTMCPIKATITYKGWKN